PPVPPTVAACAGRRAWPGVGRAVAFPPAALGAATGQRLARCRPPVRAEGGGGPPTARIPGAGAARGRGLAAQVPGVTGHNGATLVSPDGRVNVTGAHPPPGFVGSGGAPLACEAWPRPTTRPLPPGPPAGPRSGRSCTPRSSSRACARAAPAASSPARTTSSGTTDRK